VRIIDNMVGKSGTIQYCRPDTANSLIRPGRIQPIRRVDHRGRVRSGADIERPASASGGQCGFKVRVIGPTACIIARGGVRFILDERGIIGRRLGIDRRPLTYPRPHQ